MYSHAVKEAFLPALFAYKQLQQQCHCLCFSSLVELWHVRSRFVSDAAVVAGCIVPSLTWQWQA
jgi:hypothetical protein